MCFVENSVIGSLDKRPLVYTRYVDDIFLVIENIRTLEEIKTKFEEISILKFTYESECNKSLAFLDVKITRKHLTLETTVHTKATSAGECMNYLSIAPDRYKIGVIKTFLHRAFNICSTYQALHSEIDRIKQLLTNNNYPMELIDNEVRKFLNRKFDADPTSHDPANKIPLYYRSQMSLQYKQEKETLKKIIADFVVPVKEEDQVKLNIFYKNKKLQNLFMKNNIHKPEDQTKESRVVYQYTCPKQECQPCTSYIGYTECTLIDRLRNHAQIGSILTHALKDMEFA